MNKATQEGPPYTWNRLTIHSLFKKGNKLEAANYRGIAVMSFFPKLMA